ncbi:MAG: hypothetical protein HY828_22165 [Actinobacteria bacterium]|nr:hypothetical protein [Actinomycetota bacterium]
MTDFIATLAPDRAGNWEVCRREGLWGLVGRGNNWRSNGSRVRGGDRIFVWQGGRPNGFIAQIEALGPMVLTETLGVRVPWDDPAWFGGVFPMRVIKELASPVGDRFPDSNGRNGLRFGFNNTVLQHIFEEADGEVASRISDVFEAFPPQAGRPYVDTKPPGPVARADPFEVDPDAVDRGLMAHHATVRALAAWVESQGLTPLLPRLGDPLYDLAWLGRDTLNVAEVKSTTSANRESQLRLGLGQVLRYQEHLNGRGFVVTPWLVAETEVPDASWVSTCARAGVRLSWPPFV